MKDYFKCPAKLFTVFFSRILPQRTYFEKITERVYYHWADDVHSEHTLGLGYAGTQDSWQIFMSYDPLQEGMSWNPVDCYIFDEFATPSGIELDCGSFCACQWALNMKHNRVRRPSFLWIWSSNSQRARRTSSPKSARFCDRKEGKSWPINSLGNHTVNQSYSFGVAFVDFDKEY